MGEASPTSIAFSLLGFTLSLVQCSSGLVRAPARERLYVIVVGNPKSRTVCSGSPSKTHFKKD